MYNIPNPSFVNDDPIATRNQDVLSRPNRQLGDAPMILRGLDYTTTKRINVPEK
jgi:hypothetical protein